MTTVEQLREELEKELRSVIEVETQRARVINELRQKYQPIRGTLQEKKSEGSLPDAKVIADLDRDYLFVLAKISRSLKRVWRELVGGFLHHPVILGVIESYHTERVAYLHRIVIRLEEFYQGQKKWGGGFRSLRTLTGLLQQQARLTSVEEMFIIEKKIYQEMGQLDDYCIPYQNDFANLIKTEAPELLKLSGVGKVLLPTIVAAYVAFLVGVQNVSNLAASGGTWDTMRAITVQNRTRREKLLEEIKAIALAKQVNILQRGLLVHGSCVHGKDIWRWTRETLRDIMKRGLISPMSSGSSIAPNDYNGFNSGDSNVVFFSAILREGNEFAEGAYARGKFGVFFIVDPKKSSQWFFVDKSTLPSEDECPNCDKDEKGRVFEAFVQEHHIQSLPRKQIAGHFYKTRYGGERDDLLYASIAGQVMSMQLPFENIIGIVLMNPQLIKGVPDSTESFITIYENFFDEMNKNLAVPIYDEKGNLLWPKK